MPFVTLDLRDVQLSNFFLLCAFVLWTETLLNHMPVVISHFVLGIVGVLWEKDLLFTSVVTFGFLLSMSVFFLAWFILSLSPWACRK